jgi:hypothetical protein
MVDHPLRRDRFPERSRRSGLERSMPPGQRPRGSGHAAPCHTRAPHAAVHEGVGGRRTEGGIGDGEGGGRP